MDEDEENRRAELWQASHILLEQLDEERARFERERPWREERSAAAREAAMAASPTQQPADEGLQRLAEQRAYVRTVVKDEVQVAITAALTNAYDWIAEAVGMAIGKERARVRAEVEKLRAELRNEFHGAAVRELNGRFERLIDRLDRLAGDDAERPAANGAVNGAKGGLPH